MKYVFVLLAGFLFSSSSFAKKCESPTGYNQVLQCAQSIHYFLYNRQAETRSTALQAAFGGIEPGLRYHSIKCPGNQVPVSGGSDFKPHERNVYTLPLIRANGGYHVFDFTYDSDKCIQSQWTQFRGRGTAPASIPFRKITCRTGASGSAGPEYINTQLSLPVERYLNGPGAQQQRYVQSSPITYSRDTSTAGVESSQSMKISDDRVKNLLWVDLRGSVERLTASIYSDSEAVREFWRDKENVEKMGQLVKACNLTESSDLTEGNVAAEDYFNAYANMSGLYRSQLLRQGGATPATKPASGSTSEGIY